MNYITTNALESYMWLKNKPVLQAARLPFLMQLHQQAKSTHISKIAVTFEFWIWMPFRI